MMLPLVSPPPITSNGRAVYAGALKGRQDYQMGRGRAVVSRAARVRDDDGNSGCRMG
jgi:hypothetical protein